jgi:hypothetical protein
MMRVVGDSEDAKILQASTQSLLSVNFRFCRHRKGSQRRRSLYRGSAERPAAARAVPLLGQEQC